MIFGLEFGKDRADTEDLKKNRLKVVLIRNRTGTHVRHFICNCPCISKRRNSATPALHRDHYGNNLLVHNITYGRAITGFRDNNDYDTGHHTT